jgi:hypothetical protein
LREVTRGESSLPEFNDDLSKVLARSHPGERSRGLLEGKSLLILCTQNIDDLHERAGSASGSICHRQPYQNSGNPCSRITNGPSFGPAATACSMTPFVVRRMSSRLRVPIFSGIQRLSVQ